MITEKKCKKCSEIKSIDSFYKREGKGYPDGYMTACKDCYKKSSRLYKERTNYFKTYYKNNKEKFMESSKIQYSKNKNNTEWVKLRKEKDKIWKQNNKERMDESRRKLREKYKTDSIYLDKMDEVMWARRAKSKMHATNSVRFKKREYSTPRHNPNFSKEITVKFLQKLRKKQKSKCYWLGIDIDFTKQDFLKSPSVDRLDNNRGYYQDNVVLTTVFANYARNRASVEEMKKFVSENLNVMFS
tara:strand:+ start:161 stop:889 length:729 start_codon:yes stop_codon:yes gene_type:complete